MKTRKNTWGKKALASSMTFALALSMLSGTIAPALVSADETESLTKKFYTDFTSFAEEQAAASALNEEIADESNILMKNKDNMLPFTGKQKVSVFGVRSVNLQYGGSGSGSSSSVGAKTMKDSLEAVGYEMNPKLVGLYNGIGGTDEPDVSIYENVTGSYRVYDDAALVVLSRSGSEFTDNLARNVSGHEDGTDHVLMLQDNEKALIEHVTEHFEKVVIVLNTPNAMEVADLEDNDKIGAIVWIGLPGDSGMMALGRILNGEVNPSGRTVDIWAADQTKDPVFQNWSNGSQLSEDGATPNNDILNPDGSKTQDSTRNTYKTLEYEEGIYMGYRWYETAAAEGVLTEAGIGYEEENGQIAWNKGDDVYYNRSTGVIYPFGYGLSYTSFKWEVIESNKGNLKKSDDVTFTVRVTNTGAVAGKDVVQIYSTPEYYEGGIEKAVVNLIDFAKTELLAPGEYQDLEFSINAQDFASFDYNDANGNGFVGYELEEGDLTVSLRANSHDSVIDLDYTVVAEDEAPTAMKGATGHMYKTDAMTGAEIKAVYSQGDLYDTTRTNVTVSGEGITFTSRADFVGTFPTALTAADVTYKAEIIAELQGQEYEWSYEDETTDAWYKTEEDIPDNWTQASKEDVAKRVNGKTAIQLADMSGLDFDDPKWDEYLNSMTFDEMRALVSSGMYGTPALEAIGKYKIKDQDGPAQLKGGDYNGGAGMSWISEVNIASTWNLELAEKQGIFVGNDSLYIGVNGWYGPALNTHRHPLSGRNFEYYSQDGVQGGKIAAAVIKGAVSKGVHVYGKHFFLNDQEQDRYGVITWANEQAIREIYLKQFELAIKEGGMNGTMSAFNRIGLKIAANYNTYEMIRNEFGFQGTSVTDMYGTDGTTYYLAGAGNDLVRSGVFPLGDYRSSGRSIDGVWDEEKNMVMVAANKEEVDAGKVSVASPTQWYAVRNTTKELLYVKANTNSALNGVKTHTMANRAIELRAGVAVDEVLGLSEEALNGCTPVYTISGTLPKGVTWNAAAGKIIGSATELGTYTVKVDALVDGWINATATYTINVVPTGMINEAIKEFSVSTGYAVGGTYGSGWMAGEITELGAMTVVSNVPGVTYDAEKGVLSGTPTQSGTFTVEVTQKVTYSTSFGSSSADAKVVVNVIIGPVDEPVAPPPVEVPEEVEFAVIDGKLSYKVGEGEWTAIEAGSTSTSGTVSITASEKVDGVTTLTITNADGTTTTIQINDGANGADGVDGKGCASVISIGSVAVLTLLGAAIVIRKKED